MAKATRRKTPAKRKPSAKSSPFAFSGWVVAAGLGAVLIAPQARIWSDDVLHRLPFLDHIRSFAAFQDDRPSPSAVPSVVARSTSSSGVKAPLPSSQARLQDRAVIKPMLPPIKSETIAEIVRKAEAGPSVATPKLSVRPPSKTEVSPQPPASVPMPMPIVTAAIRREPVTPFSSLAKPGELAIRRYPFTTAPAIAYVGDLRTIRILGGEGDWKKVEVSATGVTGWLRLQRLGSVQGTKREGQIVRSQPGSPIPAASSSRDTATGSR